MVQISIEKSRIKEKNEKAVNSVSIPCSSSTLLKENQSFIYPLVALKFEFSGAIVYLDTFAGENRQRKTCPVARIFCFLIIALSLNGWETQG